MDMKRILQALDTASSKPVEGANDIKKALSIVTEGATPHKVALPVQMAMQHYQQPVVKEATKKSLLKQYFQEAEEVVSEELAAKKEHLRMYSQTIAKRVLMKESNQTISEVPIEPTDDPNDPVVYGHQKANPMSLKGRVMQARAQLTELAERARSDDLLVWEGICRDAKGGLFMGLEQNLEQIRHGITELAAKRRKGGVQSKGIDKNIGESIILENANLIKLLAVAGERFGLANRDDIISMLASLGLHLTLGGVLIATNKQAEPLKQELEAKAANWGGEARDKTQRSSGNPTPPVKLDWTWQNIYQNNKDLIGDNPNLIKPGVTIDLPDGTPYTIKQGDTLSGIALKTKPKTVKK